MNGLENIIDAACIVTDSNGMAPYLTDWRGRYQGSAQAVVKPRTIEEVAAVMRWASSTGTPVVPQGGNTGLSGGATPDRSGRAIVLSLERMNKIRAIDPVGNTLVAEAGCILAHVQEAAVEAGRLFPVSLGSEGSCQIGGIVATNAGGINVIRYGMTRDLVLGLEYVTAAGVIVPGPRRLRKDNAGFDLRHLLVGSEGSLAILTAAAFRIVIPPPARVSALCGITDPTSALSLLSHLREVGSDAITSFELMCDGEMTLIRERLPEIAQPLSGRYPWYVFVELGGSVQEPLEDLMSDALSQAIDSGIVQDAILAQSVAQAQAIWHVRFAVSEANRLAGFSVSHDVSVATADLPAFLAAISDRLPRIFSGARPLFVGHVGDGNMHVILHFRHDGPKSRLERDALALRVNDAVYDIVGEFRGSISAEHGIGRSGLAVFSKTANPEELRLMQGIKQVFDPAHILNPGAVVDPPRTRD